MRFTYILGLLKMTDRGYLPHFPDGDCILESAGDYCFGAGNTFNYIQTLRVLLLYSISEIVGTSKIVVKEKVFTVFL